MRGHSCRCDLSVPASVNVSTIPDGSTHDRTSFDGPPEFHHHAKGNDMLGRKDYKQEELDHATAAIANQVRAYRRLAKAVDATGDAKARSALSAFEPLFFNNMTLVLDRYFVHRIRQVTGKDGNPLNEVELLTESLMNNDGVLRGNNVVKYVPEESVLELGIGDRIRIGAAEFERLAKAFLADIERKFR
jgi:hypothetical protein